MDYIGLNVDYKNYLSKHDIVFQTPNYEGYEGLTIGNGDMGGLVWCTRSGIELQINKSDLYDRKKGERVTLRSAAHLKIDFGIPNFEWLYLTDFEARMSMFDATSSFKTQTAFSKTDIKTWVDANDNVWVIDCNLNTFGEVASGAKMSVNLERWGSRVFGGWYSGFNKDASRGLGQSKVNIKDGDIYLTEHFEGLDFVVACRVLGTKSVPELISSKQGTFQIAKSNDIHAKVIVSLVTSNESKNPLEDALKLLDKKQHETLEKAKQAHDTWWKNFWERSFVNIPDDYIENLYYYRRYLTASSSRANFPIAFNGSLWVWNHDIRQWCTPHHWNTQPQYWGLAVQNDCDLMLPYINTYFRNMPYAEAFAKDRGVDNAILWTEGHDFFGEMTYRNSANMVNNFTPASQIAGIFWEYYQFTGDVKFLREKCYPFIKKAAQFYVGYLKWDEEKKEYYCFPSQPYEHAPSSQLKNCNSDRYMIEALMNWCIESSKVLNTDKDMVKKWNHIKDHLWEPASIVLPEGAVFGKDSQYGWSLAQPYKLKPGRVFTMAYTQDDKPYPDAEHHQAYAYHFDAHTTQVYPANILGLDQKGSEYFNIAVNISINQPPFRNGISPGSIVSARLGLGDYALRKIKNTILRQQHFPQGLFYNISHWFLFSKYADSLKTADLTCQRDYINDKSLHYTIFNGSGLPMPPFIQCGMEPMSIMSTALSEMLIQSHEGKIRVFPAVTKDWTGSFVLRARGAFIVSSEMKEKQKISFVGIHSLNGNECRLQNPWKDSNVKIINVETSRPVKFKLSDEGVISFKTTKNAKYLVTNGLYSESKESFYTGKTNMEPKYFQEAMLGSKRDF